MNLSPDRKLSGLLAPLFALRTEKDLGIGDTQSLKELIDWASEHGFGLVQVLPINEPGGDNSPYNIISSLAIDPATVATQPEVLKDLTSGDFKAICARHDVPALREGKVNYRGVRALKTELLEAAWKKFKGKQLKEKTRRAQQFSAWCKENAGWLEAYTLFRALVRLHGENENTGLWPKKQRTFAAAKKWLASASPAEKRKMKEWRNYFAYVQWIAYAQWSGLKSYAEARNVAIVGDVPVGVSIYSADVFARPEIFDLTRSAGAPPEKVFAADPFTAKWGQNWGFPLYNWGEMAKDDYAWWRQRLRTTMEIFHFLRVDHALGFFRIYSFPWRPERNTEFLPLTEDEARAKTGGELPRFVPGDDSTEQSRETNRAQGDRLFRMIVEETGQHRLIAEDLGEMSPYVRPVLREQEIPGFKIPLWEIAPDGWPIPGRDYERLSLVTYATHDHPALRAYWDEWYANSQSPDPQKAAAALRQMQEITRFAEMNVALPAPWSDEIHEGLLHGLFASNSWLAVNLITDVFGTAERFNVPGAIGDQNWTERFPVTISEWDKHWPLKIANIGKMMRETSRYGV
ncbi:MAG: 4-alpha-glucanotransferase [Chthoniobacterales bacterium]|nr:4-alpha-glucanotransferase [Chthoniobacterales bacterium]